VGLAARHGRTDYEPPTNPMLYEEARALFEVLVKRWLLWKIEKA
jgi:hypothetical protein